MTARRKAVAVAKKQGLKASNKVLALSLPAAKKQKTLSAFVSR